MHWTVHLEGGPRRVNHAAVAVDNVIYSFGGYCTGDNYKHFRPMDIHALNTENYRWTLLPTPHISSKEDFQYIPFQRYGHTAVAHGKLIYIWGGRNDNTACNSLFAFDTTDGTWKQPTVSGMIPGSRDGHSACIINNCMYVFGGFEDAIDRFSDDVHMLNLETMVWQYIDTEGSRPIYRDFHTATAVGNRMYVFGGRGDQLGAFHSNQEIYDNSIIYLDTETLCWHQLEVFGDIPIGRRSHSAFLYEDHLYIFGGYNGLLDDHFNDLHRLNIATRSWTMLHPHGKPPCQRRRQSCIIVDNKLFLFGGTSPLRGSSLVLNHGVVYVQEPKLIDHNDLHILDFAPSLLVLSLLVLLESEPKQQLPPWLPPSLKWCVNNMTTPNTISWPLKHGLYPHVMNG